MKLHGTARINELNHLEIGGCDTVNIAEKYGTPLYVMDEELIRNNCRMFIKSFTSFYDKVKVAYAGKAFLNLAMCRIIDQEGMYLDVVSGGELYTALKAGFPAERLILHGNNKTMDELDMALSNGIGTIVVDNFNELYKLNNAAKEIGKKAEIYLRISPGIDAHTHDFIRTGHIDSKFGFPIVTGQAKDAVKIALSLDNLNLKGIHCHIGSQILDLEPYTEAADVMLQFAGEIRDSYGVCINEIDLGGGFGVYYTQGDVPIKIMDLAQAVIQKIETAYEKYNLDKPYIIIEPGRSIVGNAGTTLYRVGAIKDIPDVRKYIAVDGGMADNIRPALYSARYEAAIANRMDGKEEELVTVVGKCCESGDILIKDIHIPKVEEGDIIAIFTTGAYGQSMSSNYNRIPKPAVVLVNKSESYIISKRETYDEVIKNDVLPEALRKDK